MAQVAVRGELPQATAPTQKNNKAVANAHGVKVGDIFYTSWGYEQTNIDYFEVIAVSAKMATVREIGQTTKSTAWMQGECLPVEGQFIGKEQKTQTGGNGDNRYLKNAGGRKNAGWLHNGQPKSYSQYA